MISRMLSASEPGAVLDHLHVGVQGLDREPGRLGLRHPDPLGVVDHLALEVGLVDQVVVDDARGCRRRPRPGRRRTGAPSPPAPISSTFELEQLQLALDPDLGQQGVARVAHPLLRASGPRPRSPAARRCARPRSRRRPRRRSRSRARPAASRRRARSGCRLRQNRSTRWERSGASSAIRSATVARGTSLAPCDVGLVPLVRLADVDQQRAVALDLLRARSSGSTSSILLLTSSSGSVTVAILESKLLNLDPDLLQKV